MFTRSSFQTADMVAQYHLLNEVADLIDKGVLRTTLDQTFCTINAANLKRAHALIESGQSRGKIVLEGCSWGGTAGGPPTARAAARPPPRSAPAANILAGT